MIYNKEGKAYEIISWIEGSFTCKELIKTEDGYRYGEIVNIKADISEIKNTTKPFFKDMNLYLSAERIASIKEAIAKEEEVLRDTLKNLRKEKEQAKNILSFFSGSDFEELKKRKNIIEGDFKYLFWSNDSTFGKNDVFGIIDTKESYIEARSWTGSNMRPLSYNRGHQYFKNKEDLFDELKKIKSLFKNYNPLEIDSIINWGYKPTKEQIEYCIDVLESKKQKAIGDASLLSEEVEKKIKSLKNL